MIKPVIDKYFYKKRDAYHSKRSRVYTMGPIIAIAIVAIEAAIEGAAVAGAVVAETAAAAGAAVAEGAAAAGTAIAEGVGTGASIVAEAATGIGTAAETAGTAAATVAETAGAAATETPFFVSGAGEMGSVVMEGTSAGVDSGSMTFGEAAANIRNSIGSFSEETGFMTESRAQAALEKLSEQAYQQANRQFMKTSLAQFEANGGILGTGVTGTTVLQTGTGVAATASTGVSSGAAIGSGIIAGGLAAGGLATGLGSNNKDNGSVSLGTSGNGTTTGGGTKQPTTDNKQPTTTDNKQPTTDNKQPTTTDNKQPTTDHGGGTYVKPGKRTELKHVIPYSEGPAGSYDPGYQDPFPPWDFTISAVAAAERAYDNTTSVSGYTLIPVEDTDLNCLVGHKNGCILIAVQGTRMFNLHDAMADFDAIMTGCGADYAQPSDHGQMSAHNGFLTEANQIAPKLIDALKKIPRAKSHGRKRAVDVIFTGHSLGGAVAQLLALRFDVNSALDELSRGDDVNINIITFGSPRVGDYIFATAIQNRDRLKLTRFEQRGDAVTFIPALSGYIPYHHAGNCIELHADSGSGYEIRNYPDNSQPLTNLHVHATILDPSAAISHDLPSYEEQLIKIRFLLFDGNYAPNVSNPGVKRMRFY